MDTLIRVLLGVAVVSGLDVLRRQSAGGQHCDLVCDEEVPGSRAVCGSDGVLYTTKCDFNNALCRARQQGQALTYASIGPECVTNATSCDVLLKTTCVNLQPTFPGVPAGGPTIVCATDGKSYGSLCELMVTRCKLAQTGGAQPELGHDGSCEVQLGAGSRQVNCSRYVVDLGGLALEGNVHTSLSVRPCEKIYKPVCGLDGRTYSNECVFCGQLAVTHQIQSGHLSPYIKHDGSCTQATKG